LIDQLSAFYGVDVISQFAVRLPTAGCFPVLYMTLSTRSDARDWSLVTDMFMKEDIVAKN
jgi:hypothetical protein